MVGLDTLVVGLSRKNIVAEKDIVTALSVAEAASN